MREHLEATGGAGGAERHLGGLHRRRRVGPGGVVAPRRDHRLPVDPRHERQVVAVQLRLRDLGAAAPGVGTDAHDQRAERVGVLDHAVAELGLEHREQRGLLLGERRLLRLGDLGRGRRVGDVGVGPGHRGRRGLVVGRDRGLGALLVGGAALLFARGLVGRFVRHRRAPTFAAPSASSRLRADHDGDVVGDLAAPAGRELVVADALVLDPLLEHHDALQQRLRARRAARHVEVDRDDLVDALGDRVGVPVRACRSWSTTPSRSRTSGRGSARRGVRIAGAILSVTVPEITTRSAWRGLAGNGITPRRIMS